MVLDMQLDVRLRVLHPKQQAIRNSRAKRKIIRAGRRGGKTVYAADETVEQFLDGKRVLYGTPTSDQLTKWWYEVKRALAEPIEAGVYKVNETEHTIERVGTENRIRGKTAWNADTLRGDYADVLILDEYQLMSEDAWGVVGAPMLLDNDGIAIFIFTPPSLRSRSASKATDKQHANKLWRKASEDTSGRWAAFHFTSHDNPHISEDALSEITDDMSDVAYRQEIKAEDMDEAPGALWKRVDIDKNRVVAAPTTLARVVVGVDPTATATGDEAGIITCGSSRNEYYTLADDSLHGSPEAWAQAAITAFFRHKADCIVAEKNNGGEMVESVIKQAVINARNAGEEIGNVPVKLVWASRGKATRAEPISAISENNPERNRKGRDHHVGVFPLLEDELCLWTPGDPSPNRLDAKVWAMTELMESGGTLPKAQPKQDSKWKRY